MMLFCCGNTATMATGAARCQVLSIYKNLLRESQKFPTYNFKMYAIRRVKDGFRENKALCEQEKISSQLQYAKENLELIKRQVSIGHQYSTEKLIIEK